MSQGIISAKYLYDIAEAIRVKSGSQSTITPAQMAAAIANIDGTLTGTITPSTDTGKGMITLSIMAGIADAIREKLDVATEYTPSQMADAILSITAAGPTIVSWSSGSDADVAAMIDAAHAGTIDLQQDGGWAVGDVRTITVGAFTDGGDVSHVQQSIDIVISSFDEYMSCGNVMQFDFKDELAEKVRLSNVRSNTGGYGVTEMKTTTLPALVNATPDWMKSRMIEFSVLTGTTGAGGNPSVIETVTGNKLALRSEKEVTNYSSGSVSGEGSQVALYQKSGTKVKKLGHSGSNTGWWLRSPRTAGNIEFRYMTSNGSADSNVPNNYSYGLAPFGCL